MEKYILLFSLVIMCNQSFSQNDCTIDIKNDHNTVILNCGNGNLTVYEGFEAIEDLILQFGEDIESLTKKLQDLKTNSKESILTLNEINNKTDILIQISNTINQMRKFTHHELDFAKTTAVYSGNFYLAHYIYQKYCNNATCEKKLKLYLEIDTLITKSKIHLSNRNYFKALALLDKVIDKCKKNKIRLNLNCSIYNDIDNINEKFKEDVNANIIIFFDDINRGIVKPRKDKRYLEVFDNFIQFYGMPTEDNLTAKNWIKLNLSTFISSNSLLSKYKHIHSEALYKICFSFKENLANIKTERLYLSNETLKALIKISIDHGSTNPSDILKKQNLKKSIK